MSTTPASSLKQPGVPRPEVPAGGVISAETDPAGAYLRQIQRIGGRVSAGLVEAAEVSEPDLEAVRDGPCARNTLLEANLGLVVRLARDYVGRGLEFSDLIQEGNLGLMRAAPRYDRTRDGEFSSFASWWVRQAMLRALTEQARTVRLPIHVVYLSNKLAGIQRRGAEELGREPSQQELAAQMSVSLEGLVAIQREARAPLSLDAIRGKRGPNDLEANDDAGVEAADAAAIPTGDQLDAMLAALSEREAGVLRLRFGLTDGHRHSVGEIGKIYGLSHALIRQLEAGAITKLRTSAHVGARHKHPS